MEPFSDRFLEILNQKNFDDRLKALVDLVKKMSESDSVCVYVYEEEHKQLRLMMSTGPAPADSSKIKIDEIKSDLSKPFEYKDRLAIPIKSNEQLVGLVTIEMNKKLEEAQSAQIAELLKISLELEKKAATIAKLSAIEELDDELSTIPMNIDELYKKVLDFAVKVLNAERGTIWLLGNKELILSYVSGVSEDEIIKRRIEMGYGMVGWIALNKAPLLSTASKVDPRATLDIFSFPVKSTVGVPIIRDNTLIGVMMLMNRKNTDFYRTYRHFDEFDLSLLNSIINRLRMNLNQMELYVKIEKENESLKEFQKQSEDYINYQKEQVRLLNVLQKILQSLRHAQDIKNIYKMVLIGLTSNAGFKFNRALLLEKDESSRVLIAKEWLGPSSEKDVPSAWANAKFNEEKYADFAQYLYEEAMQIDISGGLTIRAKGKYFSYTGDYIFDRVINRSKIVHVTPALVAQRGEEFAELLSLLDVKEFVCIPLIGRREIYGAIVLDNKYTNVPISDDMIDILGIFSESVGLTIESLKSYAELVEKTVNLEKQRSSAEYFKDFLQNVLENLDVAIMVVDRENKILEWNRKSSELFGFEHSKMIGSSINILGPEFADLMNVAERVYDTKEVINLTDYDFKFRGKELFINAIFSPLREQDVDIIIGYIAMFEDVTRRHTLEIELRNRDRLAILGEMSAKIAHEIRNPLSAIGGFTQRAKKATTDEKVSKYLDIILGETKRLEEMVNETLEFSRHEQHGDFTMTSINELVQDVVTLYTEKFDLQGVKIEFEKSNEDLRVMIEQNHFKEVIINLVQNAFEAIVGQGAIKVKTYSDDVNVYVDVWNSGDPIPPDKLEKIFQPFYTTKTYGTGLGLAICRKIVEDEHYGKISVTSGQEGTTFTVQIPKDIQSKGGKS
jgi:two-component system, sporulation sensor kinase E|uniref:histidine kinase n=1 Tax=Mesoaciditoga lauensis TaxID=1495039 RepID=A0A7V3RDX8_9BACT